MISDITITVITLLGDFFPTRSSLSSLDHTNGKIDDVQVELIELYYG